MSRDMSAGVYCTHLRVDGVDVDLAVLEADSLNPLVDGLKGSEEVVSVSRSEERAIDAEVPAGQTAWPVQGRPSSPSTPWINVEFLV